MAFIISVLPSLRTGIVFPSGNGTTASVPCNVAEYPLRGPLRTPPLAAEASFGSDCPARRALINAAAYGESIPKLLDV